MSERRPRTSHRGWPGGSQNSAASAIEISLREVNTVKE